MSGEWRERVREDEVGGGVGRVEDISTVADGREKGCLVRRGGGKLSCPPVFVISQRPAGPQTSLNTRPRDPEN